MINKTTTLAAAMIAAAAIGGLAARSAEAQPNGPPNQYQDRNSQGQYGQYEQYRDRDSEDQYRGRGRDNRYEDGYRTGYRAGYETARNRKRYDDRPIARNDLDQRWRARYTQAYTYNDDVYYRDCRSSADPAGVIAGALIGGLVGNSVASGGARGGATVAGVIVGGALGAAMTRNLNCEDRSYAYKTYYDGFNSGRPNSTYQWRNPSNGHYGTFRVVSYVSDPAVSAARITDRKFSSRVVRRQPRDAPVSSRTERGRSSAKRASTVLAFRAASLKPYRFGDVRFDGERGRAGSSLKLQPAPIGSAREWTSSRSSS